MVKIKYLLGLSDFPKIGTITGRAPQILHSQSQFFPQQRKLMGSSAQNSSGVHWCRRRVRFNKVPEKVPKVPENVWEALVESRVKFNRVPVKVWEALVQIQVRFNRVPEKVPEKVWEALVQAPGQVQRGSGECSGEGLGGFGAERGQVPEKVPEKVWEALVQIQARFNRVPEKVREKVPVREALVQSQVRFNRVPKKVPEKVPGGFGAEPGQVQQDSEQGSGECVGVFGAERGQVQQDLRPCN